MEAEIPKAEEICKKQLYRVMDQIVKTDVDDEEIMPFMDDINRYFEYMDKEEIIKKIVSREFGKFLAYYADAPEIEKPVTGKAQRKDADGRGGKDYGQQNDRQKRQNKPEAGYKRLFINLGKRDGFYPGELMKTLNRYVGGRQAVGHIDLLDTISYFDVPEQDARKVMTQLTGIRYKGRQVRCNDADEGGLYTKNTPKGEKPYTKNTLKPEKPYTKNTPKAAQKVNPKLTKSSKKRDFIDEFVPARGGRKEDWRDLMRQATNIRLRGEEPDFSEEGWAMRKPRKKNK